jgi:hypothetical protein
MSAQDFTGWLLEAETPSICYLTLRELLGIPETSSEVQAARNEIQEIGPVPVILAGQTGDGNWIGEHSYYTPKYTSTHWSMTLLTELAADGSSARMRRGANFMLNETRQELSEKVDKQQEGWTCFYGNFLRYALYCGFERDERVDAIIDGLVFDGVMGDWRCPHNDDRPCAWGAARALWGLAAIPEEERARGVKKAIRSGLQFLLDEHSLVAADYPVPEGGKVHSIWSRLNFPLFYQADILFVLRVVAELDTLDHPGVKPALAWLEARQAKNRRWRGASPYKQRTWKELGGSAETSRWVSLQAAIINR